jgi:integrase
LAIGVHASLTAGNLRATLIDHHRRIPEVRKIDAGMEDRDLHFHDLRGTAATRFYTAGLSVRVIAEVMTRSVFIIQRMVVEVRRLG